MSNQSSAVFINISSELTIPSNAITSKEVFDDGKVRAVLFSLDAGQQLTEHSTPKNVVVTILEGKLKFTIEQDTYEVQQGDIIHLVPNAKHSLIALEPTKFSLVMVEV